MCNSSGQIVRATAGRDKGELFFVTGQEGEFLLLANGKGRTMAAPKRKKPRHVACWTRGTSVTLLWKNCNKDKRYPIEN